MKTNPLKDGVLTEAPAGIGEVTRKMVRERAVQLAVSDGRSAHQVSKSDWDQAKRELKFGPDMAEAVLESAPESERWDPLPGSKGHKAPVSPSEDEDDEGRSVNESLVDKGALAAEVDRLRRASETKM